MKSRNSSQRNETFQAKSSVFSLLRKTCNDGDDLTDFGKLFQTDAAVAGKVRSPMVKCTMRGTTSVTSVYHYFFVTFIYNNNILSENSTGCILSL